jgi:transcriptional regulator with XRE-family HTH domain
LIDKFSAALGGRLRAARRQRGWSLSDVESVTQGEFKASVVGAYERGERAMSVQRLVRVAEVYAVSALELLPATSPSESMVIDLSKIEASDGDVADRYVAAIQMLRSNDDSSEIRYADRVVLASLLEVEGKRLADR